MVPADTDFCPMCGESIVQPVRQCPACGETIAAAKSRLQSDATVAEDFAKGKRKRLIWLLGSSFATGVAVQLFPHALKEIQVVASIGNVILIGSWCVVDARERKFRISRGQFTAIILAPMIGLPVYLIRTRGIRGFWSSLLALLFGIGMIGLQMTAILMTHYVT